MLRKHYIKDINQYALPDKKEDYKLDDKQGHKEFTIGDLHGNALKLLQFLRLKKIIEMEEKSFDVFVKVYNTETDLLNNELLRSFVAAIHGIKITSKKILIRLIGDETADRGSNDYFTLKLIQKLCSSKNITLETLYSNHGNEFILLAREKHITQISSLRAQFQSMFNFLSLLAKGLVDDKERDELLAVHASTLKLMSYTLPELKSSAMVIYSHAPLKNPLEMINDLARLLGVSGLPSTLAVSPYTHQEIAAAIDRLNTAFQIRIQNCTLHEIYEHYPANALGYIAWGRANPGITDTCGFLESAFNSSIRKKFNIITVHGHSPVEQHSFPFNIGLDDGNLLGKFKGYYVDFNYDQGNLLILENYPSAQLLLTKQKIEEFEPTSNGWSDFSLPKKALFIAGATTAGFGLTLFLGGWVATGLGIKFLAYIGTTLGFKGGAAYAAGGTLIAGTSACVAGIAGELTAEDKPTVEEDVEDVVFTSQPASITLHETFRENKDASQDLRKNEDLPETVPVDPSQVEPKEQQEEETDDTHKPLLRSRSSNNNGMRST